MKTTIIAAASKGTQDMTKTLQRVATLVFFCVLVAAINTCYASISLQMTGGYVDFFSHTFANITLFGHDSSSQSFVFTAEIFNGRNPRDSNPHMPGTTVSPDFFTSSSDFGDYTLSIDGNDVPLLGDSSFMSSVFEADGPLVTLPIPPVSFTAYVPVVFNVGFSLYEVGNNPLPDPPDYIISGTGFGIAELVFVVFAETGLYNVTDANYTFGPVIPEPTTSALALAALCLAMSRRRAF